MDAGVDGQWMSYAELAEVRRIDKTSALKLAIRRGWPRQKNNHGQMQVCVPLDWAQPPERLRDTATDRGMDSGVDLSTALAAYEAAKAAFVTVLAAKDRLVIAMEATISAQAQVVAAAEVRAATLTQEAQEARQEADAERSRADLAEQTVVAERSRADAAAAQARNAEEAADEARRHVREAEDAIAELRQANELRRGQGRLARLRAAWRGA
jgi:hypothetical protein